MSTVGLHWSLCHRTPPKPRTVGPTVGASKGEYFALIWDRRAGYHDRALLGDEPAIRQMLEGAAEHARWTRNDELARVAAAARRAWLPPLGLPLVCNEAPNRRRGME